MAPSLPTGGRLTSFVAARRGAAEGAKAFAVRDARPGRAVGASGTVRRASCPGQTLPRRRAPAGATIVVATLNADGGIESTAILRTARKLMEGGVFAAVQQMRRIK